jgi:CHAT domain-containing protein
MRLFRPTETARRHVAWILGLILATFAQPNAQSPNGFLSSVQIPSKQTGIAATDLDPLSPEALTLSAESAKLRRDGKYSETLSLATRALEAGEIALGTDHSWARWRRPSQDLSPPPQQSAGAEHAPEVTTLEPGKPVEREISGGQKHGYQFPLSTGQHVAVVIRRQGINVGVTLRVPGGQTFPLLDGIIGPSEATFRQIAESSGVYQLDVYARAKAPTGRYEIRITELRPATENDRDLQRARKLFAEYWRLHRQGRHFEARPPLIESLKIREKVLEPDDLLVAATLGQLAANYRDTGDYASAEPLDLRRLKITEKAHGPDHPEVATVLTGMVANEMDKGDYVKVEEMALKAIGIFERAQQAETSYEVAWLSNVLGSMHYERGDYGRAEQYYQRARVIQEKMFGPEHFHLADSFSLLGRVAYDTGDYAKAKALYQRALTLWEKALGPDHLGATGYRNELAAVYITTGDYAKAETLYRQSLSTHEQKGAMSKLEVQETLYGLARLHAAQGHSTEALEFQTRASEIEESYVGLNLTIGSERARLAFLDKLSLRSSRHISLHTDLVPNDPAARDLAVTTILRRKGRVQDALSESIAALRQRFGGEDQQLLDQLSDTTSRLANLVLNGPQKATAGEYQEQIKTLEEQREKLEVEISRRSAGFNRRTQPATLAAVRAMIPDGAALVEFAVYRPFDPKAPDNKNAYGDPRYVAYVFRRSGEVQWRELGEAKAIDTAIGKWREALRDPARKDVQLLAKAVDQKVMSPVRLLVGDATQLLISPDGALNLIPFAALVDERGSYLVERYSLTYLTSGRDLLRLQAKRDSKSPAVVLADPAFGEPQVIKAPVGPNGSSKVQLDHSQVFFGPLPGVGAEVRALKELLPQATFLTRAKATKAALKRVRGPRILHIATHGFFLQNDPRVADRIMQTKDTRQLSKLATNVENPLLRSGLALAGANQGVSGGDNGVLTAFEMAQLNLWGTKLVVLSACDTGIGEVKNGEGVYGLRRALVLAGTESQMVSLWPVSDSRTRDLMIGYYQALLQNEGRSEALRQVQLRMLSSKARSHPYYWASFIQTGEWANLKGER